MADAKRFKLFADFGQIHVCDAKGQSSLEEAWTAQATEDRIADGGDIVGIGAKDTDDVNVSVEILASMPEGDASAWDHVTESSLDVASGVLSVLGCTDELAKAKCFSVAQGPWRVRASHANLVKGREQIRLQLWPAPRRPAEVVKRWAPPPKAPPKPVKRIASAKQAVQAAMRGETEAALAFLVPRAQKGDFAASATAIQLLAFRGQWSELLPFAMTVIAEETVAHASREMCFAACDLVRLASIALGDPSIIESATAKIDASILDRASPHLRGERKPRKMPTPEDRAKFAQVASSPDIEKRFRGKPHARAAHLMSYGCLHLALEDEMLELWDPANADLRFDHATWIAAILAHRGEGQRAWEVLESRLARWWPLTIWDVAPVQLLVDPVFAPLMTQARRQQVLATVRGSEAV